MYSEHGGNSRNLRIKYDFSANLNPLGMPLSVINALRDSIENWDKYPDPNCTELVNSISQIYSVPNKKIVCGNGADDLIFRVIRTLKPQKALVASPCFSEYEKAFSEIGCAVRHYFLKESNQFELTSDFLSEITGELDMIILCSPNNPTGRLISHDIISEICRLCGEKNIIFLCDECFLDFVIDGNNYSALNFLNENIIVLKAFTKIFSMAGLRLGYAIFGSEEIADRVKRCGQFWSVSAPAQAAGIAALKETEHIRSTREFVKKERIFLSKSIAELGIKVFDSDANFLLLKHENPLYNALLKQKILVRNCANFIGLDDKFIRIAVKNHEENIAISDALRRIICA